MKRIEYWRWHVASQTPPGRIIATRHHMTEAEALARDANARRVPGSCVLRDLPETPDELTRFCTSAYQRGSPR